MSTQAIIKADSKEETLQEEVPKPVLQAFTEMKKVLYRPLNAVMVTLSFVIPIIGLVIVVYLNEHYDISGLDERHMGIVIFMAAVCFLAGASMMWLIHDLLLGHYLKKRGYIEKK
ncbi:hypothetical protein KJ937_02645 [Patescibacteria group bacterium]|nr:hypothetical protein [Patescibacteria group bacterium]